eukprot:TRINITY_DN4532_c0_g1_i1.p1 TRINITY_DN4532_c0_g1~~TRINITY_DN4532_c0_g1_i1.p1  ORF type:complete len:131 (+),score=39.37 TRINITY_DN4532_c0_g1_i1:111-503(+)
MIRRPPRSTQSRSSAASDVYKRQVSSPEYTCLRPLGSTKLAVAAFLEPSHLRWKLQTLCPPPSSSSSSVGSSMHSSRYSSPNVFLKSRQYTCSSHGAKSVSYTHLRAHETVLDLVCRLLLEKKKTKPTKL